jgi:hypothetical protein
MPALSYGQSSYERAEGDLPGLPVINMYAEETASEGVVLQSRRGLVDRDADMGAGPVRALFKRDGVVSGSLFGVSGSALYQGTTSRGTVTGSGPVSIAGNETGIMVCAGDDLHTYDGTTFAKVTLPDDFDAIKVVEGASRFVIIRANSGRFYFTPPLQRTVDALDFATAESEADQLLDALFLDDILILFGRETVEFWPNTTDNNLPFQALEGRVIERGIRATGCATPLGAVFAWITDQNTVCVQDENNIISNPGLQERLAASTTASLFNFFIDGAEFLALRMDDETQVYNLRTGAWSEFASDGQANWLATCHAAGVFGAADGKTLAFGSDYQELGGVLERRFRAGLPINGGGIDIYNLRLRVNPGQTGFLTGDYADPVIEMRLSRDAGQTWGLWKGTQLGAQGQYRKRIEWRGLGQASAPGFMPEFRLTDPVPLRVSGVFVNEPFGGRV